MNPSFSMLAHDCKKCRGCYNHNFHEDSNENLIAIWCILSQFPDDCTGYDPDSEEEDE